MRMTGSRTSVLLRLALAVTALMLAVACSAHGIPTPSVIHGASEPGAPWDYVALSDSLVPGLSYVTCYADWLEADLGVEVTLHNRGRGGRTSEGLLTALRTDKKL